MRSATFSFLAPLSSLNYHPGLMVLIELVFCDGSRHIASLPENLCTPSCLRAAAAAAGAIHCLCPSKYGSRQFGNPNTLETRIHQNKTMRNKVTLEIPDGRVFSLVETDVEHGCSCTQCALFALGICHDVPCMQFDSENKSYHYEELRPAQSSNPLKHPAKRNIKPYPTGEE